MSANENAKKAFLRAKANKRRVTMGGAAFGRPPMVIMVCLALALDFILGSKVYPSVSLLLVVFFLSKNQARSARHLNQ